MADEPNTILLTEVYPKLHVPVPGEGEWLDFFIADTKARYSLYWRLNDGPRDDPDTVEFGFISSHRRLQDAQSKAAWLVCAQMEKGLAMVGPAPKDDKPYYWISRGGVLEARILEETAYDVKYFSRARGVSARGRASVLSKEDFESRFQLSDLAGMGEP